jgi:penicillin G amidase
LNQLASVRFPADGSGQTLNRATPVYDFSDLDNSRFAIPLGQSGNMFSPWARSFVNRWQALRYIEIAGTQAEIARSAAGTITLAPPANR